MDRLKILLTVFAVVILGNLVFLDYQIIQNPLSGVVQKAPLQSPIEPTGYPVQMSPNPNLIGTDKIGANQSAECGSCQSLIDSRIAALKSELSGTNKFSYQAIPKPTSTPILQNQTIYFGANGSTQQMTWLDLYNTQIYFDPSAYTGAKDIYFVAELKSDAPDRAAFARIYDIGHGIGVQDSDISYAGLTSTLIRSKNLVFYSGRLNLRIQIHSLNGNLADMENPRLEIVY